MKLICYVTSCKRMVRGICDFVVRHVTLNHKPPFKVDSHRSCENEFRTFFICYMTLCDHVINILCDFANNKSALEPTSLSSFLDIVLEEVEV